jgi:hypothetical protein
MLQAFNAYEATFGAVHVNLNVAGPHQARALVEPARVDHTIQGANNPDGRKKGTNKKKEAKHAKSPSPKQAEKVEAHLRSSREKKPKKKKVANGTPLDYKQYTSSTDLEAGVTSGHSTRVLAWESSRGVLTECARPTHNWAAGGGRVQI